jgi:putative ABC transport system ATP-binding protein
MNKNDSRQSAGISKIELVDAIPDVFVGNDCVNGSQVWKSRVCFTKGEITLIEAASGTGKSSLCSYIYGTRTDYQGKILIDGVDVCTFSDEKWCALRVSALSLLPQEMRLFPELTVLENLQIKNRLTGMHSTDRLMEMLSAVGIEAKANAPAGCLSIGQQQRVAIVRALCQPFDFLILDEPVSHLDGSNNDIVSALILEHARQQGAGIIATSVGYAINLPADRILKL